MLPEPVAVTLQVVEVLDALGVPYLIGGSFASSVYGAYRATADVDLVADLQFEQVEPLVRALREQFYIDTELVRDAIRYRRSFSAIHLTTLFKVDVFIQQRRPGIIFHRRVIGSRNAWNRRRAMSRWRVARGGIWPSSPIIRGDRKRPKICA
jgi:hypothetical protein